MVRLSSQVIVKRDGKRARVDISEVVVGDVLTVLPLSKFDSDRAASPPAGFGHKTYEEGPASNHFGKGGMFAGRTPGRVSMRGPCLLTDPGQNFHFGAPKMTKNRS